MIKQSTTAIKESDPPGHRSGYPLSLNRGSYDFSRNPSVSCFDLCSECSIVVLIADDMDALAPTTELGYGQAQLPFPLPLLLFEHAPKLIL